jgi:hypothetical protein
MSRSMNWTGAVKKSVTPRGVEHNGEQLAYLVVAL